jgi:hypothetical protein
MRGKIGEDPKWQYQHAPLLQCVWHRSIYGSLRLGSQICVHGDLTHGNKHIAHI